jgi:predicted acyltransferase
MVKQRWDALDDLRGLAVFFMVPINVAAAFTAVPAWFTHAPADGLTIADLVVPVFLFSLGLSASFSYKARIAAEGPGKTFLHAFLRYGILFAFGTAGVLVARGDGWGILQMLGATGLLSFCFLLLPPWPRLGAAALMLAGVEVLRPWGLETLMRQWYGSGIAGPWGTFSLSFFAVCASALGEMIRDAPARTRLAASAVMAAVLCAGGVIASFFFPFNKHLLSLSYILFACGIASALLALLVVWRETLRLRVPLVGSLGRNALFLYMLHAVLSVVVHALFVDAAAAWIAWTTSILVLALCAAVAGLFDWRKIYIKL